MEIFERSNSSLTYVHNHLDTNSEVVKVIKRSKSGKDCIFLLENGDYLILDLVFSPKTCAFYRNGIRINLANLEARIVKILLGSVHCSETRECIMKELWDDSALDYNGRLNSTISRLRKHLRALDARLVIESERNKGYELCIDDWEL